MFFPTLTCGVFPHIDVWGFCFRSVSAAASSSSPACPPHSHSLTHTLTHSHSLTHTHLHTYTLTHLHTYTLTHLHAYTLTHLHTYTHTQAPLRQTDLAPAPEGAVLPPARTTCAAIFLRFSAALTVFFCAPFLDFILGCSNYLLYLETLII